MGICKEMKPWIGQLTPRREAWGDNQNGHLYKLLIGFEPTTQLFGYGAI